MYNILESLQELNNINDERISMQEVFEAHSELNPILFDDTDHLKNDIRIQLVKIADTFVQSIQDDNIPIHVIDYWLLGSNAQYNYGEHSDIDIHVIVDTEVEDCTIAPYLLNLLYDYVKSNFNKKYDITVKGCNVELYLEDVKSGAITNGIYSLKKDEWIKKPDKLEPRSYDITTTKIWKDTYSRYLELEDEECEEFLDDLHVMRKISLSQDGEWGDGNLVFKEFRNRGYIKDLKDRKYLYKSKELTLESLNEQILQEDTLIDITTNIVSMLSALPGVLRCWVDNSKEFIRITTCRSDYCIPIEDIPNDQYFTKDYNKRRYHGSCTVTNGRMPDPSGSPNTVPVYYGVPSNHKHRNFDDDVKVYDMIKHRNTNTALTLNDFIQGVQTGGC